VDRVLAIPSPSLVVMVGPAGSGKTAFCARSFRPTEVVSSDACRALVGDSPADQSVTPAAFALAHAIADQRLRHRRLTVFDATSLEAGARRALLDIAARHHLPAVAIVFDLPLDDCVRQDAGRAGRRVGRVAISRHAAAMRHAVAALPREGFARVHRVGSADAAAALEISLAPLPCDRSADPGPFDLVGDLHGCARELVALLAKLGYRRRAPREPFRHPAGRRAVFIGDLVDRGPSVIECAGLAMDMVRAGAALAVPGNHDDVLARLLAGGAPRALSRSHAGGHPRPGGQPRDDDGTANAPGTAVSLRQIEAAPPAVRRAFTTVFPEFVASLPSHLLLDGSRLVAAHAGLAHDYHGRESEHVRRLAVYGETTGELDRYGLPTRVNWAAGYGGTSFVVYGHTPVRRPQAIRNTLNVDTGCVYGGALTALRWPERETVSVKAGRVYYRSPRLPPRGVGLRARTRVERRA
jgi:protein phosphatase